MINKKTARIICMILLAVMLLSLSSCNESDGCEEAKPRTLAQYVDEVNYTIWSRICRQSIRLTPSEIKTCLFDFYQFQDMYSGKLLCTVDGVKYYYPNFVLKWENKDHEVTDNTGYIISPLHRDANGTYTGVLITPVDSETEAKIKEMNAKVVSMPAHTRDRSKIDELSERFKQFSDKYSGTLLCVDPYKGEIHCPNYSFSIKEPTLDAVLEDITYIVVWRSNLLGYDENGLLTGIYVDTYVEAVGDDYVAKTGELVRYSLKQRLKNSEKAGDVVEGGTYTVPDVPVKFERIGPYGWIHD